AITPVLSTEEPIDSLSMGDDHLDTIPATESDEVIKSSVEDLVSIPSEFEGFPDTICDVHFDNNYTPLEAKDHVEIVMNSNDDISSSDDDSLHEENIEYVEASPHDSELISLEAAEIVTPKVEEIKPKVVVNTARPKTVLNAVKGNEAYVVKASAYWHIQVSDDLGPQKMRIFLPNMQGNPHQDLQEKAVIDSGCLRHMTGNMSYLTDYKEIDGGYVAFRGNPKGGMITGKDTIRTVVTDDYSRFTWVFFFSTKDETSGILKSFITRIENLVDHKVKVIRCDNETEFKNRDMNQFYEMKGIMRPYSVARTPQQNGVAKRRNKTLIEVARTMLADLKLPTTFWAEAVNIGCYVQNKFDGKVDEGFFIGYSLNSKAFRVFNSRTRIVEEILHIRKEKEPGKYYILLPLWNADLPFPQKRKSSQDVGFKPFNDVGTSLTINAASNEVNVVGRKSGIELLDDPNMTELEDISTFKDLNEDVFGLEADLNNLKSTF
nr:hypothetical protein [Tanacetum cinerariifolium]